MADTMGQDSNKGLLIAAWITAILFSLVGLIISIIGLTSKKDRRFMAPLIVSIIFMVLGGVYFALMR